MHLRPMGAAEFGNHGGDFLTIGVVPDENHRRLVFVRVVVFIVGLHPAADALKNEAMVFVGDNGKALGPQDRLF